MRPTPPTESMRSQVLTSVDLPMWLCFQRFGCCMKEIIGKTRLTKKGQPLQGCVVQQMMQTCVVSSIVMFARKEVQNQHARVHVF